MKDFIKAYVTDIFWALLVTLFEIALLSGCLFVLTLLPHGLTWLSLSFFQCFIIICAYRLVTYKMNKQEGPSPSVDDGGTAFSGSFNTVYPENPEDTSRPMRNVYSAEEADQLNHETEFSVRE